MSEGRIVEVGHECRGNAGNWGRTVVHEFPSPLGPMPMVAWENVPEPEEIASLRVRLGIAEEALEAVRDTAHDDERAAIVDAALSRLREENTKPGGAD
jgi:hypothetical protein